MTAADVRLSRRRPSLGMRAARQAFRSAPLFVWCGAVVAIVLLLDAEPLSVPYRAVAIQATHVVASPQEGVLAQLTVEEQAWVEVGQVVGSMDDALLTLRLQRARDEVERLTAELARERALHEQANNESRTERQSDLRRFVRDQEVADLDVLRARAELEEDRVRLSGLTIELERTKKLCEQGLAPETALTALDTQHGALQVRVKQNESVLGERERVAEQAAARVTELGTELVAMQAGSEALTGPFEWAIRAQQVEIEEIAMLRTRLRLVAPVAGRVSQILSRPGETLVAGQRLLTIVDPTPHGLVTYVPEFDMHRVFPGMAALVERASAPGTPLHSQVRGVSAAIQQVPPRLWIDPQREEWALAVFLDLPPGAYAVPGETLTVRLVLGDGPPAQIQRGG